MKTKVGYLTIIFVCMTMSLAVVGGSAQGADSKNRPTISSGDRALAMMEVQNTFSKHAYYHQIGQHCEEIDDLWVTENGPYGKTATWTSSSGVEEGIALIRKNYCTSHLESQKQALAELSKKIPSIKNVPENIGAGGEYVMHTQETPVIEVAGDGKTAKGIWYSIGLAVRGSVGTDGKTTIGTGWMWEKYAADFAYENGEWKIWHLINIMDQGPAESGGQGQGGQGAGGPPGGGQGGATMSGGQGGAPGGGQAASGSPEARTDADAKMEQAGSGRQVTRPNPDTYRWSPTVAPKIDPKFPEPYYTFSETFSY
jgi:hypothetical protein